MSSTLRRYLTYQAPGWIGVTALALLLLLWWEVPAWIPILLVVAWISKDFALYPWLRPAYESDTRTTATAQLVGARGTVTQDLDPNGWIRVQGALWQARPATTGQSIERGRKVRVESVEGMCLVVTLDQEPPAL